MKILQRGSILVVDEIIVDLAFDMNVNRLFLSALKSGNNPLPKSVIGLNAWRRDAAIPRLKVWRPRQKLERLRLKRVPVLRLSEADEQAKEASSYVALILYQSCLVVHQDQPQDQKHSTLDRTSDPGKHFEGVEDRTAEITAALLELPAYQKLTRERNDAGCGAAMLAEKSVAVPFVSAIAGTIAIAQAIRIASGEMPLKSTTVMVNDLKTLRAVAADIQELAAVESAIVRSDAA